MIGFSSGSRSSSSSSSNTDQDIQFPRTIIWFISITGMNQLIIQIMTVKTISLNDRPAVAVFSTISACTYTSRASSLLRQVIGLFYQKYARILHVGIVNWGKLSKLRYISNFCCFEDFTGRLWRLAEYVISKSALYCLFNQSISKPISHLINESKKKHLLNAAEHELT